MGPIEHKPQTTIDLTIPTPAALTIWSIFKLSTIVQFTARGSFN
jgi:hypothetical protein